MYDLSLSLTQFFFEYIQTTFKQRLIIQQPDLIIINLSYFMGGVQSWSEPTEQSVTSEVAQQRKKANDQTRENPEDTKSSSPSQSKNPSAFKKQKPTNQLSETSNPTASHPKPQQPEQPKQPKQSSTPQKTEQELKLARKDRLKRVNQRAQKQREQLQVELKGRNPPTIEELEEEVKLPRVMGRNSSVVNEIEEARGRVAEGRSVQFKRLSIPTLKESLKYQDQFKTLVKIDMINRQKNNPSPKFSAQKSQQLQSEQHLKVKTSSNEPNSGFSSLPSRKSVGREPSPRFTDQYNGFSKGSSPNKPKNIFAEAQNTPEFNLPKIMESRPKNSVFDPQYHAAEEGRKGRSIFSKRRRVNGDLMP